MLSFDFFQKALPYDDFFTQFGKPTDKPRWDATRQKVALTPDQQKLLGTFRRKTNMLVLAGAWCGDCAGQCPIFEKFAEVAPVLVPRYLDRDAHPAAQEELKINGGNRVPVVVFFSEDGQEVSRFGERTLTTYRKLVAQLGGDSCGSGLATGDTLPGVVQNWLDEFERVQHILRLSPRLRRLHGD
ncbi:thioredoxin family protein [Limnoglobus roseus]|uniref:Thiol reductase thioredoxin n=1 Tax=Limnoglobus roseus TaxID=2598579 RepID=A0A5C1A977_9BACT|nr:thioredoxin family protein [Limnoglobus roseus]QEL15751.1 thiol reductase thioredoxin [Limnoglobus roseus]